MADLGFRLLGAACAPLSGHVLVAVTQVTHAVLQGNICNAVIIFLDNPGWSPNCQATRGDFHSHWNNTSRSNNRFFANDRTIKHDGIHANHCAAFDGGAVNDCPVADAGLFANDGWIATACVDDAAILHVTPSFHRNWFNVSAQDCVWANEAISSHRNLALQYCTGAN